MASGIRPKYSLFLALNLSPVARRPLPVARGLLPYTPEYALNPPSIGITIPVTNFDRSETR